MSLKLNIENISGVMSVAGVVIGVSIAISSIYQQSNDIVNNVDIKEILENIEIKKSGLAIERENEKMLPIYKKLDSIKKDNDELKNKLITLQEDNKNILLTTTFQNIPPDLEEKFINKVSESVEIKLSNSLKLSFEELKKRFKSIESLIIEDPEKVLSVPLLNRDIQKLSEDLLKINKKVQITDELILQNVQLKTQVLSLKEQLSQLNNWLIGIFGAFFVSITGLVINNLIVHKKRKKA